MNSDVYRRPTLPSRACLRVRNQAEKKQASGVTSLLAREVTV